MGPTSIITAVRHSKRVRKESQKARDSEDWQKWRRQVYEREEKCVRKTVTNRGRSTLGPMLSSLGAQVYRTRNRSSEDRLDSDPETRIPRRELTRPVRLPQPTFVMDGGPIYNLYNPRKNYKWITKSEMVVIQDWVRNLPGSKGNYFFVHRITPTITAANMLFGAVISEDPL